MPFGISPAPEIFQQKLDQCLENLHGIHTIADDTLITGQGDTFEDACRDHDKNLDAFLKRCRSNNIRLNKAKYEFKAQEMTFVGHILTKDGLIADPDKMKAITEMPKPTDVPGVQRLLGMVKYLAKFVPSLSDISEPIRRLTHKDTEWNWTSDCNEALAEIKRRLTKDPNPSIL